MTSSDLVPLICRTTAAFPDFAGLSAREPGFATHEQFPIVVPVADGEAVKVMDSEIEARYEMIFTKSMVVSERNLAATTERNCQEPCLSGVRRFVLNFVEKVGESGFGIVIREWGFVAEVATISKREKFCGQR